MPPQRGQISPESFMNKAHRGSLKNLCLILIQLHTKDDEAEIVNLNHAEDAFRQYLEENAPWTECTSTEVVQLYLKVLELLKHRAHHADRIARGEDLPKVYLKPQDRTNVEALVKALRDPKAFEQRRDLTYWKGKCTALSAEASLLQERARLAEERNVQLQMEHALAIKELKAQLAEKELQVKAIQRAAEFAAPPSRSSACAEASLHGSLLCTEPPLTQPSRVSDKPHEAWVEVEWQKKQGGYEVMASQNHGGGQQKRRKVVKSDASSPQHSSVATTPRTSPTSHVAEHSVTDGRLPSYEAPIARHAVLGDALRSDTNDHIEPDIESFVSNLFNDNPDLLEEGLLGTN